MRLGLVADGGTYPPLNTLKRVCDDIWIVDGPIIRFGMPWPKMPFPTRMTVIRLDRDLFLHSPTPLVPSLKAEIEREGTPRWIVGPNRLHYWWIPEWHAAFSDAAVYVAPRTDQQAAGRIDFDRRTLEQETGYPWDETIATLPVAGSFMTEMVFFHRASPRSCCAISSRISSCTRRSLFCNGVCCGWPGSLRQTARHRATCGRASLP